MEKKKRGASSEKKMFSLLRKKEVRGGSLFPEEVACLESRWAGEGGESTSARMVQEQSWVFLGRGLVKGRLGRPEKRRTASFEKTSRTLTFDHSARNKPPTQGVCFWKKRGCPQPA